LTPAKQSLALAVGEQPALALANLELGEKLRLLVLRDPLTGLLNRRFLEEWMDRMVARPDHTGRSFGLIMADIDHFKPRTFTARRRGPPAQGHRRRHPRVPPPRRPAGSLRRGEFLVLLADIDPTALTTRLEELRSRVAAVRVDHRGEPVTGATMSAGIALYAQHSTTASLVIDAADAALYAAKRAGRDRVITAAPFTT
jgi:GGDEF domain-containing protein